MQDVPRTEARSSLSLPSCAPHLALRDRAAGEGLDQPGGRKAGGTREDSGVLLPVTTPLERPPDAAAWAVADLRERFRGLLRFLKAQARARSA